MATYEDCGRFGDALVAFGLDSPEKGRPPSLLREVFDRACADGSRVDHGVRCFEDPAVVQRLVEQRVPLTVCPLSNVKLRGVDRIEEHDLARMLEAGLCATVNVRAGVGAGSGSAADARRQRDRGELRR